MTFEEWWKDKNNNLEMFIRGIFPNKYMDNARLVAKRFSEMAWEAAQPKWTLCKDGMPDTKGNFLCIWNNGFYNVQQVCMYEKKIKMFITNTLFPVIAWMPLPEYKEQTK